MIKKIRFQARLTNEELDVVDSFIKENKLVGKYINNRSLTIELFVWQFLEYRKIARDFEYQDFGCLFVNRTHIMLHKETLKKCRLFVKNKPRLCSRTKKSGINDIIRTAVSFQEYLEKLKENNAKADRIRFLQHD